jgi:HPt (histidine-containing phosphotransfer) domain-containing protein
MSVATFRHINLEYLETMTDGDADMMQTMLEMLIAEIPDEMDKMKQSVKTEDWNEIFQISHKMKTTLSYIGNTDMIELNKQLEHDARHRENIAGVPAMVEKLCAMSIPVVEELEKAY